jgi:hypothetical protein
MNQLPLYCKRYFWDVDFSSLDKKKYPDFIIERVLEYGDERAIKWLFRHFKKSELKKALTKKQNLSPLSANYWSLILNIPKNKILCLQKQSRNKLQKTWHY